MRAMTEWYKIRGTVKMKENDYPWKLAGSVLLEKDEEPDSAKCEGYGVQNVASSECEATDGCDGPVETGCKKVAVPILVSVTKVLFDNYRLKLYRALNRWLRNGELSREVGARILNRGINAKVCSFPNVTYWRIDREDFYADVSAVLKLETERGSIEWRGVISCWCCFSDGLEAEVEELRSCDHSDEGLDMLSKYLVPYVTNKRVDRIAEKLWEAYMKEALDDPRKRDPVKLAEKMGLTVKYMPVYDHRRVADSIVFFKEDYLYIGDDRVEKDRPLRTDHPEHIKIPANTIVINTNRILKCHSAFKIYHECYHFEEHYLFYRLQELANNDIRKVETKEVIVGEEEEVKDPIYFMEVQANRGAYAFLMPTEHTRRLIEEECGKIGDYRHPGELLEKAGMSMGKILGLPHFQIRARMIQLGRIRAKGALNYVNRGKEKIEPFAFDPDAWREDEHTFVISENTVRGLMERNADLRELISTGKYVYADGHVVRNTPEYVRWDERTERKILTDKANAHVDACCLRFVRMYVQRHVGSYVYGRMYCDTDYIRQNEFYLSDIINTQQVDELEAQDRFVAAYPTDFKEGIDKLKKMNKVSYAKLAEFFNMDDSTIQRKVEDPKWYRDADILTGLCLFFRLPDWLSKLVFDMARYGSVPANKREKALWRILRMQSADGLEAANEYLKSVNEKPLAF